MNLNNSQALNCLLTRDSSWAGSMTQGSKGSRYNICASFPFPCINQGQLIGTRKGNNYSVNKLHKIVSLKAGTEISAVGMKPPTSKSNG